MEAPEHLADDVREIWTEVLERMPTGRKVDATRLEVYCEQLLTFRTAAHDVRKNGVRVEDARGATVRNPSVDTLRDMTKQLNVWGSEFAPPNSTPKRRRGTMYDATSKAVNAAQHLQGRAEYAGAIEAVKTLAWLIDEAQRSGVHALQSAAYGTIPSYLKGCAALQITPATPPAADAAQPKGGTGRRKGGRASQMRIVKDSA